MKIIITILSSLILAMLLSSCGNRDNLPKENAIRLGTGKIVVKLIDITNSPDTANLSRNIYFTEYDLNIYEPVNFKTVEMVATSLPIFEFYDREFTSLHSYVR